MPTTAMRAVSGPFLVSRFVPGALRVRVVTLTSPMERNRPLPHLGEAYLEEVERALRDRTGGGEVEACVLDLPEHQLDGRLVLHGRVLEVALVRELRELVRPPELHELREEVQET